MPAFPLEPVPVWPSLPLPLSVLPLLVAVSHHLPSFLVYHTFPYLYVTFLPLPVFPLPVFLLPVFPLPVVPLPVFPLPD